MKKSTVEKIIWTDGTPRFIRRIGAIEGICKTEEDAMKKIKSRGGQK